MSKVPYSPDLPPGFKNMIGPEPDPVFINSEHMKKRMRVEIKKHIREYKIHL